MIQSRINSRMQNLRGEGAERNKTKFQWCECWRDFARQCQLFANFSDFFECQGLDVGGDCVWPNISDLVSTFIKTQYLLDGLQGLDSCKATNHKM